MPTIIDELVVRLGLDPSQFREGETQMVESLRRLESAAQRGGRQLTETTGRGVSQFFRTIESPIAGLRHYFEGMVVQTVVARQGLRAVGEQGEKTGAQVAGGLSRAAVATRALGVAGLAAFAAYEALNKTLSAAGNIAGQVFTTGLGAGAAGMGITEFAAVGQALFAHGNVPQQETQGWLAQYEEMQGQAARGIGPGAGYIQQLNTTLHQEGIGDINPYRDTPEEMATKLARDLAGMPETRAYSAGAALGLSRQMTHALRTEGANLPADVATERARAPTEGQAQSAQRLIQAENELSVAWGNVTRIVIIDLAPKLIAFANWLDWLLEPAQPGDTRNWWQRHAPGILGGEAAPPPAALNTAPSSAGAVVESARAAGADDSATAVMLSAAMGEGAPGGNFSDPWVTNRTSGAAGYWQLLPGRGEMPRYIAEGNQPGDPAAQTRYVLKRLNEIMPGFSTSTDTRAQVAAITKFEGSGEGPDYYARGLDAARRYVAASQSAQTAPDGGHSGGAGAVRSIQASGASSSATTNHNYGDVNLHGDIVVNAPLREGGAIANSVSDQIQQLTPLTAPANTGLE